MVLWSLLIPGVCTPIVSVVTTSSRGRGGRVVLHCRGGVEDHLNNRDFFHTLKSFNRLIKACSNIFIALQPKLNTNAYC